MMIKICDCKDNTSSRNKLFPYSDLSSGDLIVEIARLFINTPYKAQTLESPGREKLIVHWSAFDCTTFLETILAFVQCVRTGKISHHHFKKNLKLIRYRQGKIDGYSSRLHYFTDWLRDNENKEILTDISKSLGGKPQHKKINFMTTHRELYTALGNKIELKKMFFIEKNLSRRFFHVIGKDKVNSIKIKIKDGDIIALASNQEELDVVHVGFALWQGKTPHLLHASKKEGRVIISAKALPAFLKQNKNTSGIIVARLL
jgi:hypothetical protein